MQTIKLQNPILVDGERVRELAYDTEAISAEQFIEAEAYAANISQTRQRAYNKVAELDSGFHLALGMEAVIAANDGMGMDDLARVKGIDLVRLMEVGRNFMMRSAEEDEGAEFHLVDADGSPEGQE